MLIDLCKDSDEPCEVFDLEISDGTMALLEQRAQIENRTIEEVLESSLLEITAKIMEETYAEGS